MLGGKAIANPVGPPGGRGRRYRPAWHAPSGVGPGEALAGAAASRCQKLPGRSDGPDPAGLRDRLVRSQGRL